MGALPGESIAVPAEVTVGGGRLEDGAPQVQVLDDLDVNVTLSLSESPKPGTTPILRFATPEGGVVFVAITGVDTTWNSVLHLTPDMGSGNGRFSMEVEDELSNVGTTFSAGEYLEIYNTDVPSAPPAPVNLITTSRPGGEIDLSLYSPFWLI